MHLSNSEEQLMQILWKQKRAFMKDLIEAYEDPRPAPTTIATLLKRMQDKNFVDFKQMGRSREYFPLVKKKDYFAKHVNGLIKNFFNDSASQFASFFTEETNLTKQELKDLKSIIDQQIKKKLR
jgi:BlaI family transcriptional regulator, penicillinase repressor